MTHAAVPTHYRAAFTDVAWLRIPASVHQLDARQFFVQAGPADTPRGAALPVFPLERVTTDADGTVVIVFAQRCSGVVVLVPLPEGLPVPTISQSHAETPTRPHGGDRGDIWSPDT